jgi:hypothetical protein
MGIDVYLHWKGQRSGEMAAQLTGFRIDKGNVGYLREGYHGGPYATMALLPEGWDDDIKLDEDGTFTIEAKTLRERLPATIMVAIYRRETVYGSGHDPSNLGEIGDNLEAAIKPHLATIFAAMQDRSAAEIVANTTDEQKRQANELIAKRKLPDYALSFVDFVDLAEKKEKETGEPCRVLVSA